MKNTIKSGIEWGLLCAYCLALVALQLMFGCGSAPQAPDARYTYSPDPELTIPTRGAGEGLAAASGLPFSVGDGGTEVRAVAPETITGHCAVTHVGWDAFGRTTEVYISVAYPSPSGCFADPTRTIEHEMIHSVRRDLDHEDIRHSEHGLFQPATNFDDFLLDSSSLELLCAAADCTTFNPEN